MEEKQPLVSIGILCYNASKTIIETLNSAYDLDYVNCELIISDDCSTDNTVQLCTAWIDTHQNRFVSIKLLTSDKNKGTACNCNRIVKEASGEFIKLLAGDDVFMSNCIKDNVHAIEHADIVFSQYIRFQDDIILGYTDSADFDRVFALPPKERAHYYARTSFFCNVPTMFARKSVYEHIGYYDEEEPLLEDIPFLLRAFSSDLVIKFLRKTTVKYRHGGISNSGNLEFTKILLHAFFKYNTKYLYPSNFLDYLLVCERRFYKWLIESRNRNNLLVRYYHSRYNLLCRVLKNCLKQL